MVRKMDYQMAWKLATKEWAFLPDERDQPQLSLDPATLDPNQPVERILSRPGFMPSVRLPWVRLLDPAETSLGSF